MFSLGPIHRVHMRQHMKMKMHRRWIAECRVYSTHKLKLRNFVCACATPSVLQTVSYPASQSITSYAKERTPHAQPHYAARLRCPGANVMTLRRIPHIFSHKTSLYYERHRRTVAITSMHSNRYTHSSIYFGAVWYIFKCYRCHTAARAHARVYIYLLLPTHRITLTHSPPTNHPHREIWEIRRFFRLDIFCKLFFFWLALLCARQECAGMERSKRAHKSFAAAWASSETSSTQFPRMVFGEFTRILRADQLTWHRVSLRFFDDFVCVCVCSGCTLCPIWDSLCNRGTCVCTQFEWNAFGEAITMWGKSAEIGITWSTWNE